MCCPQGDANVACSCTQIPHILGAFHYARPTSQRPVELTKEKWNDIVRKKQKFQPDRSVPFTFRPKFRLLLSKVGLETRLFENGTASCGRTGQTGQRGPPLEVDHFFRKISTWTEAFHLGFDRNFWKFWHNGKHPLFSQFLYNFLPFVLSESLEQANTNEFSRYIC